MPTQNEVHVEGLLSNVSVAFQQDHENFIASRLFPDVPVDKQSDKYPYIPAGDFNRDEMERRADGTESAGGSFELSSDTYFAEVWAFHKDWGEQTVANADAEFELKEGITEYLTMKGLIRKEKMFASKFFTNTGVWSTDLQGVAGAPGAGEFRQWDDYVNSDPVKDITSARTSQQLLTGFKPNTLVLSQEVLDVLELHPDIIDRVKYGAQTDISIAEISHLIKLFKVKRIEVMSAIENTAAKGQAASNAWIGGKNALLMYIPPAAGKFTPSAGYTFSWKGLTGQAGVGTRILSYDKPMTAGGKRLEIEMAFDFKQVAADMGTFFKDAIS